MIRRLFTVASVLSMLMCVAAVWLLARHGRVVGVRHEIFSVYLKLRHARYTLRGDADRLALCAPPPTAPVWPFPYRRRIPEIEDPRPPEALLPLISNKEVRWKIEQWEGQDGLSVLGFWGNGMEGSKIGNRLMSTDYGLLIPGLLEALEDPQRAVAAHVFLANCQEGEIGTIPRTPTGPFSFEYAGMRVECPSLGNSGWGFSNPELLADYSPTWHVDPSQFPSLRAQWHARFDRRLVAVPYSRAAGATAVLPAIWLAAWLRRCVLLRRRRRGNLCRSCGYDLRASTDRCPECGTLVKPNVGTAG